MLSSFLTESIVTVTVLFYTLHCTVVQYSSVKGKKKILQAFLLDSISIPVRSPSLTQRTVLNTVIYVQYVHIYYVTSTTHNCWLYSTCTVTCTVVWFMIWALDSAWLGGSDRSTYLLHLSQILQISKPNLATLHVTLYQIAIIWSKKCR